MNNQSQASPNVLRSIPPVDFLQRALADVDLPPQVVANLAREHLATLRAGAPVRKEPYDRDEITASLRAQADTLARARLRPVINATGVLVHTNLGRSPLPAAAAETMRAIATGYSNLEFTLAEGGRGPRAGYLEACLAALCEAPAATMVNNCAAAMVLILRALATGERREVIVSRGELVEIGGGFRIPEILEASGAVLREVGATNKTRGDDYERAIGPQTALILKVHRSNFYQEGFTGEVEVAELAEIARRAELPLLYDLGSGAMMATDRLAPIEHEPTPAESLAAGAGLVCFSGDKLLGGPQAGVIAGHPDLIARVKREPFFRAVRCDKLVLSAMQETVRLYLQARAGKAEHETIPVVRFLRASLDDLRARAHAIFETIGTAGEGFTLDVVESVARTGGGTMPKSSIPSIALRIRPAAGAAAADTLASRLRDGTPPVVGITQDQCLLLDMRSVFPNQDGTLADALRSVLR